jgi:hypothetical protein
MAGFNFSPIKVETPPQTSLGDMLNIARGAQAYQQAQQLNPLALEKAQADLSLSQTQAQKAQRTLEYDVAHAKAVANNAIAQANDAELLNLQKQQANSSRNLIKMLDSPDSITPDKIKDHVVSTMQNAGAPDKAIIQAVQGLPTAGTDKELRAYIAKHTLNSLTAEAEIEKRFPASTMVSEGGQITPRQMGAEAFTGVKPGTAVGTSIGVTPAPLGLTQKFEPTGRVDQNNNPTAYVRDQQGNITGEVTIPAMQKNAPPPARLPAYETPETVAAERKRQLDTIAQRQTIKQSQYNYNQILNLADKTITGVGAETIAKLGGGFAAIPFTSDEATNLNLLGHSIALETGQLAARAGLGTNQGRDLALEQVSKTNWTKDAIKSTARTNRALTTGADLYGLGMENAIKAAGNNPLAARDYTSKWSSVADIDALKYYDAIVNKDRPEIKTLVDSVGGPDSQGYKDLINKYQRIYQLVTKGQ